MRGVLGWLDGSARDGFQLFARFAIVGLTGLAINLMVLWLVSFGPDFHHVLLSLQPTEFNVRWYHAYSTFAFLVANLANFQLNRAWTFRSAGHTPWGREYWPFLAVGVVGQSVGLSLLTLLLHPGSAISLPATIFDGSSIIATRLYWGQLIVIVLVTPLTFVLNKLWTFAAVSGLLREAGNHPMSRPSQESDSFERALTVG